MAGYTVQDKLDIAGLVSDIAGMLEDEGFKAYSEFTAVDTRQLRSCAAFISVEKVGLSGMGKRSDGKAMVREDVTVRVRLMGKICGYTDFSEFSDRCMSFCAAVSGWTQDKSVELELSKTLRNEQQKRLEREAVIRIGLCMKEVTG